ncbi:MAG: general secretion pathway protein GspK [Phycisphaerae bacterium]|nr:general secretion pathway protein GspK [Phycisphaerae bacterium]
MILSGKHRNSAERQAAVRIGLGYRDVRRNAFALIAVMWVVILAGLILLGVRKATRVNLAMAFNELEAVRAHWLARAGVEQAVAMLADDDTDADDMLDFWYSDKTSFRRIELLHGEFSVTAPPGPGTSMREVRYGLVDHNGKLNINTAGREELKDFCDLAEWQINSLLDWRDKDTQAEPGGAEAAYYQSLPFPYEIRNGNFQTLGELGLVKGMESDVLDGEDANDNGLLDENENNGATSPPMDNADDKLQRGPRGLCTVYSYERNRTAAGAKRVNFNTADKDTLKETFNFTDALAEAVTRHKADRNQSPAGQARRFNQLVDLAGLKGQAQPQSGGQSDQKDKINEITLKWVAEHWDELTLTDDDRLEGRINVNTAFAEVLETLPKLTSGEVEAILRRQIGGKGPFESVGELLTDEILSEEQFKAVAEKLTVRGSVFEIRSSAVTTHGIRREITAIVDRNTEPASVLYWYQSE